MFALISAYYFGANLTVARDYMQNHHGLVFPHKSNFNPQLPRLSPL